MAGLDELAFRESVFAWLRARMLTQESFSRDELSQFPLNGRTHRLVGTRTGIWKIKDLSPAAISMLTAYVPEGLTRPYDDSVGADGIHRYKWRGTDPNTADNVWLRLAMQQQLPLVWFFGVGFLAGTRTQVFAPRFPVYLVAEEPEQHQFVVSIDAEQQLPNPNAPAEVIEIARKYNERIVRQRHHQPLFRSAVLSAYERRCAVCRLPFAELLEAAHIKADADGGQAVVTNGLALCKIHHGAFDRNIIGISPDYRVHVRDEVLATVDGPTLQHAIKEMHGEVLRQIPSNKSSRPDKDLLADRFDRFKAVS